MKFYFKMAAIYGIPFGILNGIVYVFWESWIVGLIVGISNGILFGMIMAAFQIRHLKKISSLKQDFINSYLNTNNATDLFPYTTAFPPQVNNYILLDNVASRIRLDVGVFGYLILTQTEVVFLNYGRKKRVEKLSIPLFMIEDIRASKFRLNSNAISIIVNGIEEKFLFYSINGNKKSIRQAWIDGIISARNHILTQQTIPNHSINDDLPPDYYYSKDESNY